MHCYCLQESSGSQCHGTIHAKLLPGTVHGTTGSCDVKTVSQRAHSRFLITFYLNNLPDDTLPVSILSLILIFSTSGPAKVSNTGLICHVCKTEGPTLLLSFVWHRGGGGNSGTLLLCHLVNKPPGVSHFHSFLWKLSAHVCMKGFGAKTRSVAVCVYICVSLLAPIPGTETQHTAGKTLHGLVSVRDHLIPSNIPLLSQAALVSITPRKFPGADPFSLLHACSLVNSCPSISPTV